MRDTRATVRFEEAFPERTWVRAADKGKRALAVSARRARNRSMNVTDSPSIAGGMGPISAFLATLAPEQWQVPTLCARWRVRDVVAHVISYNDTAVIQCDIAGPRRIRGIRLTRRWRG